MKRYPLLFCAVALVLSSVACGTSSGASTGTSAGDGAGAATSGSAASTTTAASIAQAHAKGEPLTFEPASVRAITSLTYNDHQLAIGFSDGVVALSSKSGDVSQSTTTRVYPVAAVSPTGEFTLLGSNPPAVVNAKGDLILQMNTVPDFESAAFGADGITLYVAARNGKIRIWGQPHSFEEDQHLEKLENYLNRQAPDFLVEFPPIRGPLHVTASGKVIAVDEEGNVRIWDPTAPSSSKRIMNVGAGARSIASAGGAIIVTSQTGALKVGQEDGAGYKAWSKDARGAFIKTTHLNDDVFYVLDRGTLRAVAIETGEEQWSTTIPDDHPCGLTVSPDSSQVVACIGNYVAVFDAATGAPKTYGYRVDGDFHWK